jgi:hypothetical protein
MPQTIELEVKARELYKGDRIDTGKLDKNDVVTGKLALMVPGVEVAILKRRTKNVLVVLTNGASATLRMEAPVRVKRTVATEEEKEAERVEYTDRRIRSQMDRGLAGVAAAKDEMRAQLDREHVSPDRINSAAQVIAEAQVAEWFWLEVLAGVLNQNEPMTLEEALAHVRAEWLQSILTRGADDTWSGRGNDMRRAMFDAKRKLASDRWA